MNIGDVVFWKTGFYGGEQGSPHMDNWWPQTKKVKVIKIDRGRVLVEEIAGGDAGECTWVRVADLSADDPDVEQDQNDNADDSPPEGYFSSISDTG